MLYVCGPPWPLSAVLKLMCLACVLEAYLVFCSWVELMKSVKTGCTVGHTADTVETQHTVSGHFTGLWEVPNSRTEFTSPSYLPIS